MFPKLLVTFLTAWHATEELDVRTPVRLRTPVSTTPARLLRLNACNIYVSQTGWFLPKSAWNWLHIVFRFERTGVNLWKHPHKAKHSMRIGTIRVWGAHDTVWCLSFGEAFPFLVQVHLQLPQPYWVPSQGWAFRLTRRNAQRQVLYDSDETELVLRSEPSPRGPGGGEFLRKRGNGPLVSSRPSQASPLKGNASVPCSSEQHGKYHVHAKSKYHNTKSKRHQKETRGHREVALGKATVTTRTFQSVSDP